MKRFATLLLVLSLILMLGGGSVTVSAAGEDWDAIIEAAKKEGSLIIYNPSRMGEAAEGFTAKLLVKTKMNALK